MDGGFGGSHYLGLMTVHGCREHHSYTCEIRDVYRQQEAERHSSRLTLLSSYVLQIIIIVYHSNEILEKCS